MKEDLLDRLEAGFDRVGGRRPPPLPCVRPLWRRWSATTTSRRPPGRRDRLLRLLRRLRDGRSWRTRSSAASSAATRPSSTRVQGYLADNLPHLHSDHGTSPAASGSGSSRCIGLSSPGSAGWRTCVPPSARMWRLQQHPGNAVVRGWSTWPCWWHWGSCWSLSSRHLRRCPGAVVLAGRRFEQDRVRGWRGGARRAAVRHRGRGAGHGAAGRRAPAADVAAPPAALRAASWRSGSACSRRSAGSTSRAPRTTRPTSWSRADRVAALHYLLTSCCSSPPRSRPPTRTAGPRTWPAASRAAT